MALTVTGTVSRSPWLWELGHQTSQASSSQETLCILVATVDIFHPRASVPVVDSPQADPLWSGPACHILSKGPWGLPEVLHLLLCPSLPPHKETETWNLSPRKGRAFRHL